MRCDNGPDAFTIGVYKPRGCEAEPGDQLLFETYSRNSRLHAKQFSTENIGQRLEDTFAAATARAA